MSKTGRMLVSDCCAMISEMRDSVTDETVTLITVVKPFIGPARSRNRRFAPYGRGNGFKGTQVCLGSDSDLSPLSLIWVGWWHAQTDFFVLLRMPDSISASTHVE